LQFLLVRYVVRIKYTKIQTMRYPILLFYFTLTQLPKSYLNEALTFVFFQMVQVGSEYRDKFFACLIDAVFDQPSIQAAADKSLFPGRFKADIFYQFTVTQVNVGLRTFTPLF